MNDKIWRAIICLYVAAAWALPQVACDDESRDSDDDNSGGDSDSDSDGDVDTGECSSVTWGSGLTVDNAVANWSQTGYMDGDLDGTVEQEEVSFTLEDIHCLGVQSIVLMIGDTS